jgi:hypothetical protein
MPNIAVLIADGPNQVEVPCMFFEDFDTGLQRVTEMLSGQPPIQKVIDRGPFSGRRAATWEVDIQRGEGGWDGIPYTPPDEANDALAFFLHYYDGCGGVGAFTLLEAEFGERLVGFNLD